MTVGQIVRLVGALFVVMFVVFGLGRIVENVDSSQVVRIQSLLGGVTWYVDATGPKPQFFGKVTTYERRGTLVFEQGGEGEPDGRMPIDFNDRGTGKIRGSISYELSTDVGKLEAMYRRFKSTEALEASLIKPAVASGIYITGQLMSSFESYSSRKSELVQYVEDQTQRGTYQTRSQQVEVADELDPTKKTTITRSDVVRDAAAPQGRARTGGG
jgi:hypothetical protein